MSDEVQRVRPSRYLHPDGIVRPFVYHDSEGNQILQVRCIIYVYCCIADIFVYMTVCVYACCYAVNRNLLASEVGFS